MELDKYQLLSISYLLSLIAILVTLFLNWSNIPQISQSWIVESLGIISVVILLAVIIIFFVNRTLSVSLSLFYSISSLVYFLYVIFIQYGGVYLSNLDFVSGTILFTYLYPAPYWFVGFVIFNIVVCGLFFKNKSEFL